MHVSLDSSFEGAIRSLLHKLLSVVKKQVGEDAGQSDCFAVFLADCEDLIKVNQTAFSRVKR